MAGTVYSNCSTLGGGCSLFYDTCLKLCNTNLLKKLNGKELDVLIRDKNLAIEYCGLYWHSNFGGKDKNYHYEKYKLCKDRGIRLITLYEDEWNLKKELVKCKLLHILGKTEKAKIYARNCKIVSLQPNIASDF